MRMALAFQLLDTHQLYTAITGVVLVDSVDVLLAETDKLIEQFGGDKSLTCLELVEHVQETVTKTAATLEAGEGNDDSLFAAKFYNELATKLLASEHIVVESEIVNSALGDMLETAGRGSRGETLSYLIEEISNDATSVRPVYEKYSEQLKAQYPEGDNVPLVHCLDARVPREDMAHVLVTSMVAREVVTGEHYSNEVIANLRDEIIPPANESMATLCFLMAGGKQLITLIDQLTNS